MVMRVIGAALLIATLGAGFSVEQPAPSCCASTNPAAQTLLECGAKAEAEGDFPCAGESYRAACVLFPDEAKCWSAYGEFLRFYAHDQAASAEAFRNALSAEKTDKNAIALAWRGLGELAQASGDDEEAFRFFQRSLASADLADAHRSIVHWCLRKRERLDQAAEHARLAVQAAPGDPLAHLLNAIVAELTGRHQEGRLDYEQALDLAGCDRDGRAEHPVHCCVFYNAACYLSLCRDRAGCLTMLKAFLATPNHLHRTREDIESDPDFAAMRGDPAFAALLEAEYKKPGAQE